jgi:F-type H+-transporting ATPase subunit epsilon
VAIVEEKQNLCLEICAPERDPIEFEASEVEIPGGEGIFTVLPGHTPLFSTLTIDVLIVHGLDGKEQFFSVNGGFVEVLDNRIVILTQSVEEAAEVDPKRAQASQERAEQRIRKPGDDTDVIRAEASLERALARIGAQAKQGY